MALGHANVFEGDFELIKTKGVVIATDQLAGSGGPTLTKVAIGCFIMEMEMLTLLRSGTGNQVVKDVKVAFARGDGGDTVALEVVV
jgi:hypothetical protein